MAISRRELELSQSLQTLQSQYNEMVRAKDVWIRKAKNIEESSEKARERLLDILEQRDEEIETLKKALSESRELVELSLRSSKVKGSKDATRA